MANWSVSSLRTDHLYVPHEIADIAQRSGLYRMKRAIPATEDAWPLLVACRVCEHSVNTDGTAFPRLRIP